MIVFLVIVLVAAFVIYGFISAKSPQSHRRGRGPKHGGHRSSGPAVQLGNIRDRWSVIQATAAGGAAGLKSAVSEADKLVDNVMRSQGLPGDTMADRLKAAKSRFSNYSTYDGVWRAHKLRNSIAHDIGFDLVPSQAREALADFERGLKELGAL